MTTTASKGKTVNEYRASFVDPTSNNVVSIKSETLDLLQKDIKQFLGNSVQFEQTGDGNSYQIISGNSPRGWLSQYQVPESMSIRSLNSLMLSKAA